MITANGSGTTNQISIPGESYDSIAIYNRRFTKVTNLLYRESAANNVLHQATTDIRALDANSAFIARKVIIISFIEASVSKVYTNTFQLVLATDYVNTYGIFNYYHLGENKATAGYTDTRCSWNFLREYQTSKDLAILSNVNLMGRHVLLLTSKHCRTQGQYIKQNKKNLYSSYKSHVHHDLHQ